MAAMARPMMNMLREGPTDQNERLDHPLTNSDVIGIPTGSWSSGFFCCHENLLPSCILSFCFPPIIWAQIVIRAQIPLLIGLKNTFGCLRRQSGYGFFVDYFTWSMIFSLCLILILIFVSLSSSIFYFLILLLLVLLVPLSCLLGHTRTAFKEKYLLPTFLPDGCHVWDMLLDIPITILCLPCALSQMARHVFQYDHMDTKLGLFLGDPTVLPPLRPLEGEQGEFKRPERADTAGLIWLYDNPHPEVRDNRGGSHRQEEMLARQQQQLQYTGPITPVSATPLNPSAPVRSTTANTVTNNNPIYRQDGSQV